MPIQAEAETRQRGFDFALTIQQRFEIFHRDFPEVYRWLVARARLEKARGHKVWSMKLLYNQCRWEFRSSRTPDDGEYKFPDEFHSRYARLIMEQEPDLKGFFILRPLRSA